MSDDVVGRAREALAKGTHTSAFAVAAAGLVEELADEVESLRAAGPWTTHVEQMRAMRAERDGDCICDTDPDPETCDGPEETCPYHGRAYAEWVERGDLWQERAEVAEAEAARLRRELRARVGE